MTDRLSLYNGALIMLGERKLASLSENTPTRYYLDDIWNEGAMNYCLEQGYWNFAMRSSLITYTPSIEPSFGYRYAMEKPSDLIRLAGLSVDEYFNVPLNQYEDEAGYWYADLDEIYVRYVSNDSSYGADMTRWTGAFILYFQAYLAERICERVTQSVTKLEVIMTKAKRYLSEARSKDAQDEATKFLPTGNWVRSRMNGSYNYGRNRRRLIG